MIDCLKQAETQNVKAFSITENILNNVTERSQQVSYTEISITIIPLTASSTKNLKNKLNLLN